MVQSFPLERLDVKALKVGECVRLIDIIRIPGGLSEVFKVAKQWLVEPKLCDDTDESVANVTGEPGRRRDSGITPFTESLDYGVVCGLKVSLGIGGTNGCYRFLFEQDVLAIIR